MIANVLIITGKFIMPSSGSTRCWTPTPARARAPAGHDRQRQTRQLSRSCKAAVIYDSCHIFPIACFWSDSFFSTTSKPPSFLKLTTCAKKIKATPSLSWECIYIHMRNSKWGLKDLNLATIAQVLIIIANIILSIINSSIAAKTSGGQRPGMKRVQRSSTLFTSAAPTISNFLPQPYNGQWALNGIHNHLRFLWKIWVCLWKEGKEDKARFKFGQKVFAHINRRPALPIKGWHCNHGATLTRASDEKGSEKARLLFVYGCSSTGQPGYDRTLSFCGFVPALWSREGPGWSVGK